MRERLGSALDSPDTQVPLRQTPLLDDRRSLRPHHRAALVRAGPPLEAPAGLDGAHPARRRACSISRAAPATSPTRSGRRRAQRRPRHHGRAWSRSRAASVAHGSQPAIPRRRHDGAALSRRDVRRRHDRLRHPQRAGDRAGAGRDWLECCGPAASSCRSTSIVPSTRSCARVYLGYLTLVGSTLGLALHGDPDTYRYIPESIRRYPGAEGVSRIAREQGFAACERFRVLGGLMAIHRAVK